MKKDMLVNKTHLLDKSFIPNDLAISDNNENNFHNYIDGTLKPCVVRIAFDAFNKFREHALKDGYDFIIDSGYRSYEYQERVLKRYIKELGEKEALKRVALPGSSEHQTGLAIDVTVMRNDIYQNEMEEEEYEYLEKYMPKYGFILRYPCGKEGITGYDYEPWHYRYVGKELALYLTQNNLTLEEYHNKKGI